MPGNGDFITIQGLKRTFKMGDTLVRALDGIDLRVERGEFLSIVGPSGSGKSTLLYLLGGLDRPTEGTILVDGKDITALDDNALAHYRRHQVGFVFQTFNLIPTMTAQGNVEFPMLFARTSPGERQGRAQDLLEQLGLGDRMHHKPTELSGGQQQRVALARALVNRPDILLGDEPTGNLDTKTGQEILEMLRDLNQEGQTVILVSHDPRVGNYATQTLHLLDGRIVSEEAAPL